MQASPPPAPSRLHAQVPLGSQTQTQSPPAEPPEKSPQAVPTVHAAVRSIGQAAWHRRSPSKQAQCWPEGASGGHSHPSELLPSSPVLVSQLVVRAAATSIAKITPQAHGGGIRMRTRPSTARAAHVRRILASCMRDARAATCGRDISVAAKLSKRMKTPCRPSQSRFEIHELDERRRHRARRELDQSHDRGRPRLSSRSATTISGGGVRRRADHLCCKG